METGDFWPENAEAVALFCQMSTQWRVGMAGATGLDYTALYPLMAQMDLEKSEWRVMLEDIRQMEEAALGAIHAKE